MSDQKKEPRAPDADELQPEALEKVSGGGAIPLNPVRLGAVDPPEPDRGLRPVVLTNPPDPVKG